MRRAPGAYSSGKPLTASRPPSVNWNGLSADQPPAGRADCAIKGNIGKGGERIYHVPGSAWYARTRIDEARGERWFCTESEARRAGWRPPLE